MKKYSKYSSFALSAFIILCLVASYFIFPAFQDFADETVNVILKGNTEETHAYFKEFGIWGPIAIIVFIILQMFLIIFPSWLPVIISVMAYGLWWGVLISLTGVMLASAIGYFIGIKLKGALEGVIGEEKLKKMDFWITHYAFGSVILFRISPFLSNDSISFIAGMLNMKFKKFMLATFCGMLPLSIAIGYFSEDISTLKNGMYWIGGAGIVAYAIYIIIDYRKRRNGK
ncbi:VTT domain-containing protein [Salegentibacter sp. F188]|uniref:TVP38/TMEM64 family membrane protein n=1 Tax=Autumnicola patrickiae TaxID=3075591 RepID=A0ABU3DXJ9_9FLAO|nr:VTT domain-containing protein [Salegentibacter sp. F188]MDT0688428.1 VTT domain-containing protein [Salegentibacter sp. F188]